MTQVYVWCTYRDWSFHVLDGLLDLPGWRCGLIITTRDCRSDLSHFEQAGIPVLRCDPVHDLKPGGAAHGALQDLRPAAIFHYGWSWLVPKAVLALCPNVTLHPGKLPRDRGGSPIQNQIRNGETWSYANLLELVPKLDEGPVYDRERFSLAGEDVDAVWARMVSAGVLVSRRFLVDLAAGRARAEPQDATITPTLYRRVTPAQAELCPAEQTGRQMYDVVRAHNETDPNTYVVRAWVRLGDWILTIDRASPALPDGAEEVEAEALATLEDPHVQVHRVNEGTACLVLRGSDALPFFLTRVRLRPASPPSQA